MYLLSFLRFCLLFLFCFCCCLFITIILVLLSIFVVVVYIIVVGLLPIQAHIGTSIGGLELLMDEAIVHDLVRMAEANEVLTVRG